MQWKMGGIIEMRILLRALTGAFPVGAAFLWAISANAAPPASCAKKFIGVWIHHGIGGITNKATLTADGTAASSDDAACLQGTWTCNGNVLTYNNGMYLTDYTLQPDGTMTAHGGIVVTRVGRASVGPGPVPANGIKGDTWVKAARAAQQYCTYADQMKAAEDYQLRKLMGKRLTRLSRLGRFASNNWHQTTLIMRHVEVP
jgi:hypothetical protein